MSASSISIHHKGSFYLHPLYCPFSVSLVSVEDIYHCSIYYVSCGMNSMILKREIYTQYNWYGKKHMLLSLFIVLDPKTQDGFDNWYCLVRQFCIFVYASFDFPPKSHRNTQMPCWMQRRWSLELVIRSVDNRPKCTFNSNLAKSLLSITYCLVVKLFCNYAQGTAVILPRLKYNCKTIWQVKWLMWTNEL